MHQLIEELLEKGPVITDGAWGTQLQNLGLKAGENPESWNLSHPEKVMTVPRAYVAAGSGIVLTNTFGANRLMLEKYGLADKTAEINREGVAISKAAAKGTDTLVFGSMGPSGKMLTMGEVSEDQLEKAFTEQAKALAEAGADGIVIETMTDLAEAVVAVAAAKTTGLAVVGCTTFDSGADLDRTMMGDTAKAVAEQLEAAGADVIGSNCGQGIEGFIKICHQIKAVSSLPVWVKANAGLPQIVDEKAVYTTTPKAFAAHIPALVDAGACFIGGCCGTDPSFIKALKSALA